MKNIKDELSKLIDRYDPDEVTKTKTLIHNDKTYYEADFSRLGKAFIPYRKNPKATLYTTSPLYVKSNSGVLKNYILRHSTKLVREMVENGSCALCHGEKLILALEFKNEVEIMPNIVIFDECSPVLETCSLCNGTGVDTVMTPINSDFEQRLIGYEVNVQWQRNIKDRALKFLDDVKAGKKPWFYISGQVGSGKTKIITEIAKELNQGISSVFGSTNEYDLKHGVTFIDYLTELSSTKAIANTPEYSNRINELKNAEVLVIDDVFKSSKTEADIKMMFMIIKHRDEKKLITIFSSEIGLDRVTELDESTGTRIRLYCGNDYEINLITDESRNQRLIGKENL